MVYFDSDKHSGFEKKKAGKGECKILLKTYLHFILDLASNLCLLMIYSRHIFRL